MKYRRNIPFVGKEEIDAVTKVIESKMLVRGKVVKDFEKMFAEKHNKKYCVMTSSCTTALQLALEAITKEHYSDRVLIPDYTFFATGNAVLNVGLEPKIIDVDIETYNIDTKKIEVRDGEDIIMPVHVFGNPCTADDFKDFDVPIVEDAATAIGSKGIGFGDIQCFSFHGAKIMTTGIGGCLTTDSKDIADWAETQARSGRPYWKEEAYNYQISNMNAAMGIEQLKKLDYIIETRRKWAKRYNDLFSGIDEVSVQKTKGSNYQSYVVRVLPSIRDELIETLRNDSIEACVGYYSMTRHYFDGDAPVGNSLDDQQLCLPLYVQMTEEDQDFIVDRVKEAIKRLI